MTMKALPLLLLLLLAACRTDSPPPGETPAAPEPDRRTLDIAVAVFAHMFEHADDWDRENPRRLVSVEGRCPARLLERLRDRTNLVVLSPFDEGAPVPRGDDSLFYEITEVTEGNDGEMTVECHVVWHPLAARGYEYRLRKKAGKWVVVDVEFTWLS